MHILPQDAHCIVTPDFPGPVRNGGIGTHCLHLAQFLKLGGCDVTILYTGAFEKEDAAYWARHFNEKDGIEFHTVTLPEEHFWHMGYEFNRRSREVAKFLEARTFAAIHFQEWRANGFIPMQRRRTLGTLAGAVLTITLHSSSEWIAEGSQIFPRGDFETLLASYAERYAVAHADLVMSPSAYMFEWAASHGWILPEKQAVVRYLTEGVESCPVPVALPDEVIFFGRLETRKGLELFVEALRRVSADIKADQRLKVLFLGKEGFVHTNVPACQYLETAAQDLASKFVFEIETGFDLHDCQRYLKGRPRALVVIPSLQDNYPFAVLECLQMGLRLVASRTDGIPEMVADASCLFAPTVPDLARVLREKLHQASGPTPSLYTLEDASDQWRVLLEETLPLLHAQSTARGVHHIPPAPSVRVTLCIAHYNYGAYLGDLLESLTRQTCPDFTVIVIDDGSTEESSVIAFNQLSQLHAAKGWRFLAKANGGIGQTRNHAAELAGTEFLIFMDADNTALPAMVETFLKAIERSSCDCLTSYFLAFPDGASPDPTAAVYGWMPPGPCLEAGFLANVYGDANFIIRRAAFDAVGGFTEDRHTSFEDWELLAKLALAGHQLDVIPEPLFLYRHTAQGFSRSTSAYQNQRRALRPYLAGLDGWQQRMLNGFVGSEAPFLLEEQEPREILVSYIRKLEARQAKLLSKLEAEKERHQRAKHKVELHRRKPRGFRKVWRALVSRFIADKGEPT